jgi:hypothetical protein
MLLVVGAILGAAWLFALHGQYTTGSKFQVLLPLALMALAAHFLLQREKRTDAHCHDPAQQRQSADLTKKRS